ncbi:MAG TPA: type III-A CRISPR-associated RAMP protein Csm4 [Dysgonamonadaceae bacterium]|nr:type III-A CRISPR-associated RAMP protein Csm4 [Dysgonamonadaceae bacterium]
MPSYHIIKLSKLSPLHIGTGKENYDFSASELQSDTLSSALAALRAQNGNADDLPRFLESFTLSSAFPYYQNHYFLPKMQGKINVKVKDTEEQAVRKDLKKVKYIELPLWKELIAGKSVTVAKNQLKGNFLSIEEMEVKLSKADVHQRVSVPREGDGDAEPFYFEWNFFNDDSGLYVLVDCEASVFVEIKRLFEQLGETGLGTDKNVGGGKFEINKTDEFLELPDTAQANGQMVLSLYLPKDENELLQLNLSDSKFDITLRGGYMAGSVEDTLRHLRKRSVFMFTTGSVFSTREHLSGKIVDLQPRWNDPRMHPVYRSGKPFVVSVNLTAYE